MRLSLFGLVLIIAATSSCRSDSNGGSSNSNSSANSFACADKGGLGLINGRSTAEFRSVVLLGAVRKSDNGYKRSTCTGTYVGPNAVLTAAHCVDGSESGGLTVMTGDRFDTVQDFLNGMNRGTKPLKAIFGTKFGETLNPNVPEDRRQDMAILIMPGNSAPAVTPILDHRPQEAQAATTVGFGAVSMEHPEESLAVVKRYGYNRVRLTYPGIAGGGLFITGRSRESRENRPAIDSMSAPGDSGGPMFINGAVAGTVTGGSPDMADPTKAFAVYLDLNNEESLATIARAQAAGAQVQRAAIGPVQSAPFASPDIDCKQVALANSAEN